MIRSQRRMKSILWDKDVFEDCDNMKRNTMKKWTILIYCNGNNELEPEMCRSLLRSEKTGSSSNINIIMQLGRIEKDLVKILRPQEEFADIDYNWSGVRRYYVTKRPEGFPKRLFSSELVEDLSKINMADSKTLYDFIKWGIENYPAQHYMLVLGGHGFLFLGSMADYSQELPYIMGIPPMAKAISLAAKNTGSNIDILVLDACNMNFIEIMGELSLDKNHGPKKAITYIQDGAMAGIPYDKLTGLLEQNCCETDMNVLIRKLIGSLELDLVGIELNNSRLTRIKQLSQGLCQHFLTHAAQELRWELFMGSNPSLIFPLSKQLQDMRRKISSVIIDYKRVSLPTSNLLNTAYNIPWEDMRKAAYFYSKLDFAKNNALATCLQNLGIKIFKQKGETDLRADIMPIGGLYKLILVMNPNLNNVESKAVLERLLTFRQWHHGVEFKLNI